MRNYQILGYNQLEFLVKFGISKYSKKLILDIILTIKKEPAWAENELNL